MRFALRDLYPTFLDVADSRSDKSRYLGGIVGKEAEGTGVQALFDKINEVVRQGNVRRVVVSDNKGRKVLDVPVNAGVIAAVLAPMLTAAGAALALAGGWHIKVEHTEPDVVDGEADDVKGNSNGAH